MKTSYPKIKFVYSLPYDRLLTEYENKVFDQKQIKEVKDYIEKLKPKWDKISNQAYRVLQEIVRNKWQEKEIKCYVVKYCKVGGISSPLTIRIEPDLDYAIAVLIHELAHILVCYDFKKYKKIKQELESRFPKENPWIIRHIYINFIELQVSRKLFDQKFIDKVIKRNLSFKGRKAWKIVLDKENNLKKLFKT